MTIKIEWHSIQTFPPSNLNRDDSHLPKDCYFGGTRRARISSQALKRAIRLHPAFAAHTGVANAQRTRWLAAPLQAGLVQGGLPVGQAAELAAAFVAALLGKLEKPAEGLTPPRSKVLFYVSPAEVDSMLATLLAHHAQQTPADMAQGFVQQFSQRTSAPDMALFGRMLANQPALRMEAACQVAHAISTHAVNLELDFFSAVDDLAPGGPPNAGMLGMVAFNAATYYRYAALDWGQLHANLNQETSLARNSVAGFLAASARAIPGGKQHSFAAQTPPALVMVVLRADGQAWSLANAFERAISPTPGESIEALSITALAQHWQRLQRAYGEAARPVKAWALVVDERAVPEALQPFRVPALSDLIAQVLQALPGA
jgi:CRISPR system Cascade subunit CasC